jgi:hypothetical protein
MMLSQLIGDFLAESALEGGRVALSVLTFRGLPYVVALSASPDCSTRDRVVAISGYSLLAHLAVQYASFEPWMLAAAYVYLIPAVTILFWAAKRTRSRAGLLFMTSGLLLLLPAFFPVDVAPLILLLGWGAVLSAYSYGTDSAIASATWVEYLFFVLVNPTFAYPNRGAKVSAVALSAEGLLRTAAGAASLAVSGALAPVADAAAAFSEHPILLQGPLRLTQFYLAHSGLAHVQIGLMRQLGHRVPECYEWPLFATSPKDFWSRWNTYVGSWVRLYVFLPLALRIGRLTRARAPRLRGAALALSTVLSFLCIGFLHDVYKMAQIHQPYFLVTAWFTANGLLVVVWEGAAFALKRRHIGGLPGMIAARVAVVGVAAAFAGWLP